MAQRVENHSLLGIGHLQLSVGGSVRSSSSAGYLSPANECPNLTAVINTLMGQLVQTGTKNFKPSFRVVKFTDPSGPASSHKTGIVYARKEFILSAGSAGTPQILQLSGIGNKTELQAPGIKSTLNNPNVGKNLSDHALLPANFYAQSELKLACITF